MLTIRPLTAADNRQARDIWELRFHDSLSFIDWFFTERFAPETSFCAEQDGRIVSIAHGAIMQLRVRNAVFPAMMISGVATLPGYEGRGLMKQVLFAIFSECRRRNIPLAFHKPSHFSIYRAVGEFPCCDALFHTRTQPPERPITWDALPDAGTLLKIYAQATKPYSGCVIRSLGDMEKRVRDLTCDGARFLLHRTGGIPDGYLFASQEDDGSLYCEEALALSCPAYEALVSRLPSGSVVKLPPDAGLPGEPLPWGVMIPVDVAYLLRALCGDPAAFRLAVLDGMMPWNNGVFDGAGVRTEETPTDTLSVGRLMQFLCGYLPFQSAFSQQTCYCADEY
ncbi:MAG: GNAT family N-acetyltransferase [Clostridiales bacterium]|nr:GNAT family N-acetyltransferase [Clostridiales bacterium]